MAHPRLLAAAALASLLLAPAAVNAASFDCARARSDDERAVCASPVASRLDAILPGAYAKAKAGFADDAIAVDRDFLADRKACGSDAACLIAAYLGVLERFRGFGAPAGVPSGIDARTLAGDRPLTPELPGTLGSCAATTVAAVAPRLQGDGPPQPSDYDNGTSVRFANGGYQVSYDREPAVIASKPHDPVTLCLVALPHHCPKGDDRGRFYIVTNTRTGGTWTLPDSQHLCGGA